MANKELSFNLGLGASYSAKVENQELAQELYKLYNAVNTIATKLDEYTGAIPEQIANRPYITPVRANKAVGVNRVYGISAVDLVKGTLVYLTAGAMWAKASSSTSCRAIVLEDTLAGQFIPLSLQGVVEAFSGLIVGSDYVNSHTTPGAIALSVPAGQVRRYIGFALTPTTLAFYPDSIGVLV